MAFALAGLLIAVTAASLLFVGYIASEESTRQAISNEERLFRSALNERLRALVREQIGTAYSDETVAKAVRSFDPAYARTTFDTLWSNYRHSKVLLVSGDDEILAESFEDYTHITRRPLSETPELEQVIKEAQALYMSNRVRVPGGYGHRSLQGLDPSEFAVMGFLRIDGKPALFGAMPVMPDQYETTLPDGMPTVLLSADFIDESLLRRLNAQLDFSALRFELRAAMPEDGPFHMIYTNRGTALGSFRWDSQTVTTSIWPTVIPVIAILSAALAALAFGIAWRIGQLTTSLQISERQNRFLALHDTLSGLANRLQFNRVLESSCNSLPGSPFAVLHCDLDKFKAVNDTYGHAAGDQVIKTMADRLTEAVGSPGLVCRIGGDEFMIIYRASVERRKLDHLCITMIAMAVKPIEVGDGNRAHVGLSIGIALAPDDAISPEELVAHSDSALYHAKKMGRGRHAFYADLPGDTFLAADEENSPPTPSVAKVSKAV
ncbi:sensor domain-containing diguanylate cyclase [Roseibium denhamense]|uniref:sensor domain-containing diguanylate cyclase n=1 Tax=Roseibium denhamense TaxID=76305 RepID=UPI001AD8EEF8|nr:diguanylate cyclase [Roseibium denhamense]